MNAQASESVDIARDEWNFRKLLEALPVAIYTTDATGQITYFNQAAVDLWGRRPNAGEQCGSWRLYRADGTPLAYDECPMAIALKENRAVRGIEAIVERPDGSRVACMPYPTPLHDSSGALIGAVNMLVDITHLKQAEHRQRLFANELNHRVKNTLATVQSIAARSFRDHAGPQALQCFEGRLLALSKAHDVLTRENWNSANLQEIVTQAVEPLRAAKRNSWAIEGPALQLAPPAALSLTMVIHELATNAASYGAASAPAGRISISWSIDEMGDGNHLHLHWTESGGPAVLPTPHKGFGSRLIEQGLMHELGATAQLQFRASGVVCDIDMPLR